MTKPISAGPPTQECLTPLFNDVFSYTQRICLTIGIALAFSAICQLGLCGGMPSNPQENDDDANVDQVEYNDHEDQSASVMKPAYGNQY